MINDPAVWQPLVMMALLMAVLWLKNHLVYKDGYRAGATQGFVLGIDRTIKILTDKNMIIDGDNVIDSEELLVRLAPIITDSVVKEIDRMIRDANR